jgi:type I restriction enzyme M protein
LTAVWAEWEEVGRAFWLQMDALVETLDGLVAEDVESGLHEEVANE